jgi:hypothetical protein
MSGFGLRKPAQTVARNHANSSISNPNLPYFGSVFVMFCAGLKACPLPLSCAEAVELCKAEG